MKLSLCVIAFSFIVAFLSFQSKIDFSGYWKPFQVTIWNNYHNDSLVVNLDNRRFDYSEDIETLTLMTASYKDSLLRMLSKSHLKLNKDGTFIMEDYGFLAQAFSDSSWHGVKIGSWSYSFNDSTFKLVQSNGLIKCYKMLAFKNGNLSIGELFECKGRAITDIVLRK